MSNADLLEPEKWLESPLVRTAIARCSDDAEAIDWLETLEELMLDLEAKAPGVPFAQILGAVDEPSDQGLIGAAKILAANGHDEESIDFLLGGPAWRMEAPMRCRDVDMMEALRQGLTVGELARQFNVDVQTVRRVERRLDLILVPRRISRQAEIRAYAVEHGVAATLKEFDLSPKSRRYVTKLRTEGLKATSVAA